MTGRSSSTTRSPCRTAPSRSTIRARTATSRGRTQQKNYAALVTRLDRDVGRLLDLLRELGVDENTLVMFSGDNGSSFDAAVGDWKIV